jgi:hypothetical protein
MRRNLPADHPTILAWQAARPIYCDRQIVNIAKVHQVRRWRTLRERCQIFASLDVAEYVLMETLLVWRWMPDALKPWLLGLLAVSATGIRQGRSTVASTCVPVLLSYLRALTPRSVVKVCAREIGIVRTAWWRQASETRAGPPAIPWGRVWFQLALTSVVVASFVWPDTPHAGILTALLSTATVVETRTAGVDTNGGAFVTGATGTDFSQQDAKNTVGNNISTTDAVAVGTGVITSVTASFTAAIVGNIIYLQGGTGTLAAGWYQVTVFTSATSITVDRNVAAGTGITMNIGGALASLGMVGGIGIVSGNIVHLKTGTYSIASATPNIATGCFSSAITLLEIQGYQTTRGDLGAPPVLQASGISTFTILTSTGTDGMVQNVTFDGAGLTSSAALVFRGLLYKCGGLNCTNGVFQESSGSFHCVNCSASGCSAVSPYLGGNGANCLADNNTVTGILVISNRSFVFCLADSNTGASSDGFNIQGVSSGMLVNSVAYANGRDGVRIDEDMKLVQNVIAESNAGIGINNTNQDGVVLLHNATFGQATGISVGTGKGNLNIGAVAGSGSFFVDAANQNFALNNTAGAGAAARAAGYPGVLAVGGTGYLDIGALQHADPAGAGGGIPIIGGSIVRMA